MVRWSTFRRNGFATVLAALVCVVTAPPAVAQLDELRRLRDQIDPRPAHPAFSDPIGPDSPNAVGRYIWLGGRITSDETIAAGEIERDLATWRLPDYYAELDPEERPDIEAWRGWLEAHRELTDVLVESSRLNRFDPMRSESPRALGWPEGDTRRGLSSAIRRYARVLQDDAIRLWIEGERDASIDRAEAIVRIGRQIVRDDADVIDALVASSIQRLGLTLVREMGAATPTEAERRRLVEVCLLVPSDDPDGGRAAWSRSYRAQRAFVREQLDIEGGGDALWLELGGIVGAHEAFAQLFGPMLAALESGDEGDGADEEENDDDEENETLPAEWAPGEISVEKAVRAMAEQYEDVTHTDLVEAYERSCGYGDDILKMWDDEFGDALFRAADEFVNEDQTLISSILLGPIGRFREEGDKTIAARNWALAVLCGADPAP